HPSLPESSGIQLPPYQLPPSLAFVIYGAAAKVSVGDMFIAGVVPGILMGLIMMLVVYVFAVKRDFSAGPKTSWKEKWEATRQALPCIGLPIIVVGGIMGGFFTPTEAAAAAVLYSLILSAFVYRTVGWKELWKSIIDSAIDSGTVMLIVGGCYLFGWVISNERWAVSVTNMLVGLHTSLAVKLLLVNLVLLVVGMFMDSAPAIMLVAPILAPAMASLGVDPIQTGMIVCLNLTIGLATPPVGVCLYTATNIARCKFGDTVRNAVPFLVAMLAALAIITNVPVVSRIPFILMGR
ncbi:TRAP transporter large permease, partial [Clostridium sp.]|uniref:TRAP transporter large permease n=1 Tax=Clostridium sp. TaxID=1506 RepID=UPI00307BD533